MGTYAVTARQHHPCCVGRNDPSGYLGKQRCPEPPGDLYALVAADNGTNRGATQSTADARPQATGSGLATARWALPNQQAFSTATYRPLWRDWALGWNSKVSTASYWQQVEACAHLLIQHLGDDIERWKELIQQFENLPGPVQREFLERLSDFAGRVHRRTDAPRRLGPDPREDRLAPKICRHQLGIPADTLTELESVRMHFEPEDAVARNAWLFGPRWQISETPEGEAERLDVLCPQALRDILDEGGWQALLRLVEAAEAPEEVGIGSCHDRLYR